MQAQDIKNYCMSKPGAYEDCPFGDIYWNTVFLSDFPDGEEQDAYVLGVDEPVEEFSGVIIAIIIYRYDDVEEKWVVAPENVSFTVEEIEKQVHFQEQYFKSEIRM